MHGRWIYFSTQPNINGSSFISPLEAETAIFLISQSRGSLTDSAPIFMRMECCSQTISRGTGLSSFTVVLRVCSRVFVGLSQKSMRVSRGGVRYVALNWRARCLPWSRLSLSANQIEKVGTHLTSVRSLLMRTEVRSAQKLLISSCCHSEYAPSAVSKSRRKACPCAGLKEIAPPGVWSLSCPSTLEEQSAKSTDNVFTK